MFVHLHCHSQYSFLRAVPRPEEIVAAAAEQKMPAVALTDTNGLYAAVPFYQAACAAGVKPIVGVQLDVCPRGTENLEKQGKSLARQGTAEPRTCGAATVRSPQIVLLATDAGGYSNLCRLVTRRQLEDRAVTLEELNEHRAGLLALYHKDREPATCVPSMTIHRRFAGAVAALKEIFGGGLYLEAQRLAPGDGRQLREMLALGRELGVAVVATNNVHFLRPDEYLHHRVLNAVRVGTLLSKIVPPFDSAQGKLEIAAAGAYFKSAAEMQQAFPDHSELLYATLDIAGQCNLELSLGKTIFPECTVPEGETPFSYLWRLCFEGARQRYRPLRPEVLARLTHELEVIHKLNLAPYFLLVWEIVEEARRRAIPAVARGSAASSMATYCLGISRICPLRWNLYFERFLNEQRGDVPDIDIDICGARRDELLEWVYERWGAGHVAMIGSFVTMHARMAVREVAKVFGVSPAEVNQFTRRLPHRPVREIREAIRTLPECRTLPAGEEPWKTILDVSERLDGFPRHTGIHPCGAVIAGPASGELSNLVPLEIATKGIVVTQYDMSAIGAVGLVKMDLLGQRGLTTMSLALANIAEAGGEIRTQADVDAIPEGDPATCAMLAAGRTMGVFQIESPGMRTLLRTFGPRLLGPTTLEDLSLSLALIRPGASEYGSKETFLRRIRGQEPVTYAHPRLADVLGESLGVCVYQEQVMQLAQSVGEMTLAEADLVRRSMAKFSDQRERDRLRAKFLKAAERLGLEGRARDATWQMVEKFAGFGFCKAHAATYADLSYRFAYLKAHWPAEFLAAMCSSGAGFYHVSAYVEEAKRWGVPVLLPSVNFSRVEYIAESPSVRATSSGHGFSRATAAVESAGALAAAGNNAGRAMRIGLMQVKGLRAETMRAIVKSREERGAFRSLDDFLLRVPVERDEIESLIKCGAFDDAGEPPLSRPALLWRLRLLGHSGKGGAARQAGGEAELFPGAVPSAGERALVELPVLAEYTREQRLEYEQQILEVCVSGHPLDRFARNGEPWSTELEKFHSGKRVMLPGWLITFRHVGTKNYQNMMFLTLEDQRGTFEVVMFPEAYRRFGGLVFESRALRVTGRLEAAGQINCEKLERMGGQ